MVVTEVRKYMEAAVEKLTPAKAQEMARSLLEGQSKGREQVQRVAQDLMEWSNQTRDRMADMVRREVARQLKTMGVPSKDEVDALKARVRELERAARSTAKATAKVTTPAPKRTTPKGNTATPKGATATPKGATATAASARARGAARGRAGVPGAGGS